MGVKRWRKKVEDRSIWAIIMKEALVKLQGPYAKQEEEEEDYSFYEDVTFKYRL
jgi:hypothetical protein